MPAQAPYGLAGLRLLADRTTADHSVSGATGGAARDPARGQGGLAVADRLRMSTTDTNPRIVRDLDRLGQLERKVSDRRRQLHRQIDELYLAAPLDDAQMAELDELEETERAVSRQRRKLHETIDELRAKIGLPRWRDEHELDNAA